MGQSAVAGVPGAAAGLLAGGPEPVDDAPSGELAGTVAVAGGASVAPDVQLASSPASSIRVATAVLPIDPG